MEIEARILVFTEIVDEKHREETLKFLSQFHNFPQQNMFVEIAYEEDVEDFPILKAFYLKDPKRTFIHYDW